MTVTLTGWTARVEGKPKATLAEWMGKNVLNEVLVILLGMWVIATVGMAGACWLIVLTN